MPRQKCRVLSPQGGSDWTVERAQAYLDGMDTDIAALFPDSFVDSELGPIPARWEVGALDDVIEIHSGDTPKTSIAEYWGGDIPWYTAKDAPSLSDVFVTITRQTFKLIDTIIPPPRLAGKFETSVQPMMSHVLSNLHESHALTALRDTLLPKLVSGEVRVRDTSNYAQRDAGTV